MAMKVDSRINYDVSVEIMRSPTHVFAAFTYVPAWPRWSKPVKVIRDFTGKHMGVGTTYTQVSIFLAKEYSTEIEVTAFVPGKLVKQQYTGPISGEMLTTFSEIANGTVLNMLFSGETNGFFGITAPLLKTNLQKQLRLDLNTLKTVLESS